jgi:uncharacterized protein (DUF736 family)
MLTPTETATTVSVDDLVGELQKVSLRDGNLLTFDTPEKLSSSSGTGSIETLKFGRDVSIRPVENRRNAKAPTHALYTINKDTGRSFKLAEAWMNEGSGGSPPYFNIKGCDPEFFASATAFKREENVWEIVFKPKPNGMSS